MSNLSKKTKQIWSHHLKTGCSNAQQKTRGEPNIFFTNSRCQCTNENLRKRLKQCLIPSQSN